MEQEQAWRELDRLYKEAEAIFHLLAKRSGLSDSAFLILYALVDLGEGCLQRDICTQYSLSPQTVNSSLKKLAAQGYLRLEPGRGRGLHLFFTGSGRQLVQRAILPAMELERRAFGGLEPWEQASLVQLEQKYLRLLQAQLEKLPPTSN